MIRRFLFTLTFCSLSLVLEGAPNLQEPVRRYDIVVYGGSCAGITAAMQAARMGKRVALISPETHLGGMTINGLGWTDVDKPSSVGGIAYNFFQRIHQHYQNPKAWAWEKPRHVLNQMHTPTGNEDAMWVFEPHVAEAIFEKMLSEHAIDIIRGERLDRQNGVIKNGTRIERIIMESGLQAEASFFIDATYVGDLMATAGVSYYLGREPNRLYGETLNGIQTSFDPGSAKAKIDPYIIPGDPSSGLLPRVRPNAGGLDGEGDRAVQSYNFRMCLVHMQAMRVPIEKPEGYDEREYEMLFRRMEVEGELADFKRGEKTFFKISMMPNRKTDSNNEGRISTDYIGMSWDYVEADYETREKIKKEHEKWQRGFLWTIKNHERTPEVIRERYKCWGLPKDEFVDNNHWPRELYIREARRLIGSVVITEKTCLGKETHSDTVGLSSYEMDSHATQYIVSPEGYVAMEGVFFEKGPRPFGISYRALIPKAKECTNLLIPICLSASHVAYGSLRMEPVFMVLGQSCATAASLAIDMGCTIQEVPYTKLRARLLADKQALDYTTNEAQHSQTNVTH